MDHHALQRAAPLVVAPVAVVAALCQFLIWREQEGRASLPCFQHYEKASIMYKGHGYIERYSRDVRAYVCASYVCVVHGVPNRVTCTDDLNETCLEFHARPYLTMSLVGRGPMCNERIAHCCMEQQTSCWTLPCTRSPQQQTSSPPSTIANLQLPTTKTHGLTVSTPTSWGPP